jgi:FkbM family methyltransferase
MLIHLDDIVKKYNIRLSGVLHVGAHEGEENDAYLSNGSAQESIYWIEANPVLCDSLSKRLPNVIQGAVSDKIETVTFHVTNNYQSSSILELEEHKNEHPHIHVIQNIQLETVTLDSIVDKHSIRANFLNMDIQGAELKCLRGFENNISMIDYVYTEVNTKELYKNCALLHELDEWLYSHGFERKEISITSHGWGDALYIRKPLKFLFLDTSIHRKNREGFLQMCKDGKVDLTISTSPEQFDKEWDLVFIPCWFFDPTLFPNTKAVLYGPHNFVLVEGVWKRDNFVFPKNCFYNVLCPWVNVLQEECGGLSLTPIELPFPVNIETFKESNVEKDIDCFVYFKQRPSSCLNFVINELTKRNLSYKIISYGSYSEDIFMDTIHRSKFGIWIGRHESQGFAFEETLACNVPLLVWDVKSMFDEHVDDNMTYKDKYGIYELNATVHPYWDETCGISFTSKNELSLNLDKMIQMYDQFQPRKYIEKTLSPKACLNRFVKELKLNSQDLFVMTSVINTGDIPWSYAPRSVYSVEERFLHTIEAIQSIRFKNPSAKILFIECSDLSEIHRTQLSSNVDYFINLYSNDYVRHSCIETNKKGFGEVVLLKYALQYIFEHKIPVERLFKISARYRLNDNFCLDNFSKREFTFKKSITPESISTILFSVPHIHLQTFYTIVCNIVTYYETHGPTGIETILPQICHPRKDIDIMGVQGYIAVNRGELISA